MPLNPSKGKMFKSVGWTWNPIVGCTHDCLYCWAKALNDKWKKPFEPAFRESYLKDRMPNDGSWVFVGSMGDAFCDGVPEEWQWKLLDFIQEDKSNNKFLLQTKNPLSFFEASTFYRLEHLKHKVILGTTLETTEDTTSFSKAPSTIERYEHLRQMKIEGFKTFLSLEPLADFDFNKMIKWIVAIDPEAIEIGLENYTNYTTKPSDEKIKALIYNLDALEIPYVLKDNLASMKSQQLRPETK